MKKVSSTWSNLKGKINHSSHIFLDSTENIEDEVRKEIVESLIKSNEPTDFNLISFKVR